MISASWWLAYDVSKITIIMDSMIKVNLVLQYNILKNKPKHECGQNVHVARQFMAGIPLMLKI